MRGRMNRRGTGLDGPPELGFRDDLLVHIGRGMESSEARSRSFERHLEPETIPGHNAAAEFGVVNAAKRRARSQWSLGTIEDEHCRELRQRLDLKNGRHDR